jgi:hypothetical protein
MAPSGLKTTTPKNDCDDVRMSLKVLGPQSSSLASPVLVGGWVGGWVGGEREESPSGSWCFGYFLQGSSSPRSPLHIPRFLRGKFVDCAHIRREYLLFEGFDSSSSIPPPTTSAGTAAAAAAAAAPPGALQTTAATAHAMHLHNGKARTAIARAACDWCVGVLVRGCDERPA